MAWREVTVGEILWSVAPVAERVANSHAWRLMLSCRPTGDTHPPVWASTGLQSSSRSDLYAQADRLSDAKVASVVAKHIAAVDPDFPAPGSRGADAGPHSLGSVRRVAQR
jgi:hypothetical protein